MFKKLFLILVVLLAAGVTVSAKSKPICKTREGSQSLS